MLKQQLQAKEMQLEQTRLAYNEEEGEHASDEDASEEEESKMGLSG